MEQNVEAYLEKRGQDIGKEWKMIVKEGIRGGDIWNELSPIEALFFIEWEYQMETTNDVPDNKKRFFIYPQGRVIVNKKRYRVDFFIEYTIPPAWDQKERVIIVELDSYLWHGQKPDQFEKEKKRERDLMKEGYKIIRFSGREIVRNVEKCVMEVIAYAQENIE